MPCSTHQCQQILLEITHFLTKYGRLYNFEPPNDFLVAHLSHSLEDRYPDPNWYHALVEWSNEDLISLVRGDIDAPTCMNEFVSFCHRHSTAQLFQTPNNTFHSSHNSQSSNNNEFISQNNNHSSDNTQQSNKTQPLSNNIELNCQLPQSITKSMSKKKQHEVQRLLPLVKHIIPQNLTNVIDVGAGHQYLTKALVHHLPEHIKFLALDRISYSSPNIKSIQCEISLNDTTQFKKLVYPHLERDAHSLLIGLHTCGNLAASCCRLFIQDPKIVSLVSVPCCYHKLTERNPIQDSQKDLHVESQQDLQQGLLQDSQQDSFGFPMSSFLKNLNFHLTTGGLSLACLSPNKWTLENSLPQFRLHSLRCALYLYFEKSKIYGANYVGNIPQKVRNSFSSYVKWATQKMLKKTNHYNTPQESIQRMEYIVSNMDSLAESIDEFYEKLGPDEHGIIPNVKIFWCLRAILAPVVESFVILDRYLFLCESENVENVEVVQLFDGVVSPRNLVLLANKKDTCVE